jgi:hypothetical protein
MPPLKIKFSHIYPKLHDQTAADLVSVRIVDALTLHSKLVNYDTKYSSPDINCYQFYPLPKFGLLLQLIFVGNYGIPFCTLRRHTPQKEEYYRGAIGRTFEIVIKETD